MSRPSRTRRIAFGGTIGALALALATAAAGLTPARAAALELPSGLSQLLAAYGPGTLTRGIATFDAVPTAGQASTLSALGLSVQRLHRLPLALVYGPVSAMKAAVTTGGANDVYPDTPIEFLDTYSSDAMGAAAVRAAGYTGAGMTVAVIDSGCDASHPDLADHVIHNLKVYSGEYLNQYPPGATTIAVPIELLPYSNSDVGSGHGTHVAGIIAADSTTDPSGGRLGVVPDASLVCYSVGEVAFVTAAVTAYDHLLDQPNMWGVRVINNSWGNSFQQFDPGHPVAIATKAAADNGAVVVFAAGNSGYSETEMSLNPFSQSPWVIAVAASNIDAATAPMNRAEFSSNGLIFDNSQAVTIGAGGHTVFTGDRIGVYHPDVTAPGDNISSTCSTAGTIVPACPPPNYGNATAGGTSMASPHVAGAAAALLQANPNLTPEQVRVALQSTADPIDRFGDGPKAPFWQVGYGHVDLAAAVQLVKARNWSKELPKAAKAADARVLAEDGYNAVKSDFWTYAAPPLAVLGTTDQRSFSTTVGLGVTHLKVALSHPSLAVFQANGMEYTVTVRDASGRVLGTTTEAPILGAGTAFLFLDLRTFSPPAVPGTLTFDVSGELAASDPDTLDTESLLGRVIVLTVVQLAVG
jgi:serine protease AprX